MGTSATTSHDVIFDVCYFYAGGVWPHLYSPADNHSSPEPTSGQTQLKYPETKTCVCARLRQSYYQTPSPSDAFSATTAHKCVIFLWVLTRSGWVLL